MSVMSYTETRPPIELAPWVASWWTFTVSAGAGEIEHRIPLTGGTMISVGRDGMAMLVGPRIEPLVTTVRSGDVYRGVHFVPGAASAILGVPVQRLKNALGPAALLLEPSLAAELSSVAPCPDFNEWSRILISRTDHVARPDAAVQLAVALIAHARGTGSIAAVARAAKCSPRTLRKLFADHVGLTPKELARIIRLRSAAAGHVVGGESWLDLAAEQGFSDQPHLVREFRSILGVTPGQFASHAKRIAHRLV